MALEDACRELEPIAAALAAEADLCSQIAAGVNSGWDKELIVLVVRTMASGIAQLSQLLPVLTCEAIELECAAALAEA